VAPCSRGVPLVLVGRGPDFAWSATSSQADNLDLFVETLCDDDHHYLYRGQCEPMRRFVVGTLKAQGSPIGDLVHETTHGPSSVRDRGGKRVAISLQRSTRGRECSRRRRSTT
jgi:acyl-homoserine lactone acylase PvdQ